MSSIQVGLPDDQLERLREMASQRGISVEELARRGLEEWLSQSPDRFRAAAEYVVEKNVELYRRLAQ